MTDEPQREPMRAGAYCNGLVYLRTPTQPGDEFAMFRLKDDILSLDELRELHHFIAQQIELMEAKP